MKIIKITSELLAKLREILSYYSTYKRFSSLKSACYKYTSLLGVNVCPYCNINYCYTVDDVVRPELDHFVPKCSDIGKELSLDPYNLIPACHTCNAILKRDIIFSEETHLHPFKDDFDSIIEFSINLVGSNPFDENDIEIIFSNKSNNAHDLKRAKNNIDVFKLLERYSYHRDTVVKHFHLMSIYNSRKRSEILDILNYSSHDYELKMLMYNYISLEINSVSLGKLIKDIYNKYLRML